MADEKPAPVAAPAAPSNDNAPKPAISPSDAARTLRQLRDERRARAEAAPPSQPSPKPPGDSGDKPANDNDKAKRAAEPPTDDVLKLIQEDRRIKAERKALEAERAGLKDLEPDIAVAKALRAARAGKDYVGALKAAGFTDAELYEGDDSLFWKLADLQKQAPAGEASAQDVKEVVEAALDEREKKRQADEEAAEAERRQRFEAAEAADRAKAQGLNRALVDTLKGSLANYPMLEEYGGIPDEDVSNWRYVGAAGVEKLKDPQTRQGYVNLLRRDHKAATGRDASDDEVRAMYRASVTPGFVEWYREANQGREPSHKEILDHFEGVYRESWTKQHSKLAPKLGLPTQPPPAPAPNGSWRSDVGSPPATKAESLDEIRARRRAALSR